MPHRKHLINQYIEEGSIGVEIGVWTGEFTNLIISSKNIKKLYALDPWISQPKYPGRWYGGKHPKFKNTKMDGVYENVKKRFKDNKNVHLLRDYSTHICKHIKVNELDWAYIDGNHSCEFVTEDLENCRKLVKNGGYLLCDDYHWKDPQANGGPKKAIQHFCKKYNLPLKVIKTQAVIKNIK